MSGSRKAGGPALGTTARASIVLDVAHRPRELAVDLRRAQPSLLVVGHVVHHRVPDGARVLEPVQVDRAVGAQRVEVGGAAVVLVDEPRLAVVHHHRRVAARAVGDRGLDVDRDREARRDLELLTVDGADELGEPERRERALLLTGGVAGQQDRDVAAQVPEQPRLVVVVAVEVGDVEEVGVSRSARAGRRSAGRCGGTRTRNRRTRGRTTDRTGSTRRPSRSGCRHGRSTSHA